MKTVNKYVTLLVIYLFVCGSFMIADAKGWIAYDSNMSFLWWIGYIISFPIRLLIGIF